MYSLPEPSSLLLIGFSSLVVVVLLMTLGIAKRYGEGSLALFGLGYGAWLGVTAAAAASGLLARWELRPPPALVLFIVGFVLCFALSRHPRVRRIAMNAPIGVLIGFQVFRLPLELIMHLAYDESLMPIQMSYSGRNFDILTGLLALGLGLWSLRSEIPRWAAWTFNLVGLMLLFNVVGIAVVSTPAIEAFGPDRLNLWVAQVPFVWLPTVFVLSALLGHLLLTARLRSERT